MRGLLKALAVLGGIAAALALVIFFALPQLIDAKALAKHVQSNLKSSTGLDFTFTAEPHATFLPSPRVELGRVTIRNVDGGFSPTLFAADNVILRIGVFSALFSDTPTIFGMDVIHPSLAMEVLSTSKRNWLPDNAARIDMLDAWSRVLQKFNLATFMQEMTLQNGDITHTDSISRHVDRWDAINMKFTYASTTTAVQGTWNHNKHPYSIEGQWENSSDTASALVTAKITQDQSSVAFKGSVGPGARAEGVFDMVLSDVWPWLSERLGMLPAQGASAIPTKISGKVSVQNTSYSIEGAQIALGETQGTAALQLLSSDEKTDQKTLALGLNLSMLDITTLLPLYHSYLRSLSTEKTRSSNEPLNVIPPTLLASLQVNATRARFAKGMLENFSWNADVRGGQASITDITADLAGKTHLTGQGMLTNSAAGLVWDGNVDLVGESLRTLVADWKILPKELPGAGYEPFTFGARLYLSPQEYRLYEARLQSDGLGIAGAVLFYPEATLRMDAALGIKSINFDHLYDVFFPSLPASTKSEEGVTTPRLPSFEWIRSAPIIHANLRVDDFTFAQKKGETLSTQITIKNGMAVFDTLEGRYDGRSLKGSITIDGKPQKPFFQTSLTLDTATVPEILAFAGWQSENPDPSHLWSKRPIMLPVLQAYEGSFTLSIDRWGTFDKAEVKANLKDNVLTVPSFTANLWEGTLQAAGTLNAGTLPAVSAKINLNNVALKSALAYFKDWHAISGRASFSIDLAGAGLTLASWVSSLQGNIGVAARDVTVEGLDLATLVKAASAVRTVGDIKQVLAEAVLKGQTLFSGLSGNFSVMNGKIQANSVTPFIATSSLSRAMIAGTLDLNAWTMEMLATFPLASLSASDNPAVGLIIKGAADAPQKQLETSALEAFVARRTAQDLLLKNNSINR